MESPFDRLVKEYRAKQEALEAQNARLTLMLARVEERTALLDKNPLPKCESLACVSCAHAVFQMTPTGGWVLMGCGKDRQCKDYQPLPTPDLATRQELIQQGMQER